MSKKVIMGLAAALMAVTALQAPAAEAKGKGFKGSHGHKFHHKHKHFGFKWHKPYHYVVYNDCGYYFYKWKHTGKLFWKTKYFACKGFY